MQAASPSLPIGKFLEEDFQRIEAIRPSRYVPHFLQKPNCYEATIIPKVENAVLRKVTNSNLESKGKAAAFLALGRYFKTIPGEDLSGIQTALKTSVATKALGIFCLDNFPRHLQMDLSTFQCCFTAQTLSSGESLEILLAVAFDHLYKVSPPIPSQMQDDLFYPRLSQHYETYQAIARPANQLIDCYRECIVTLKRYQANATPHLLSQAKAQWKAVHAMALLFSESSFPQALHNANVEFEALYEITHRSKRKEAAELEHAAKSQILQNPNQPS